jgi:Na+/H+ antiporter NhaD/arsenite permease-like protein
MTTLIIAVFVTGYLAIALEHELKLNKTAPALITGVLTWVIYTAFTPDKEHLNRELIEHLGDVSGILFFLFGAMTIVELIDSHDGFGLITKKITVTDKRKLLWIISILTFFMSSILDNLTTTIVMVSLLRKLISEKKLRMLFVGLVIIAANAGGAWTPIGDVTTTMLWIGGQISTGDTVKYIFIPSMVSLLIPLIVISFKLKGNMPVRESLHQADKKEYPNQKQKRNMLVIGVLTLIMVPVFKYFTHLPPFMGILIGLGVLWIYTDYLHRKVDSEKKKHITLVSALHRVDFASILFFLGILLAVAAMQTSGILGSASAFLNEKIGNLNLIVMATGILSSIVDNVPLVAAAQGMYDINVYPMNHYLWQFLTYCAGTGGSILIIGSAAGVAAMGMEKISFFWYVKNISLLALIGYLSGAFIYILQRTYLTF